MMLTASSIINVMPSTMMTSIEWWQERVAQALARLLRSTRTRTLGVMADRTTGALALMAWGHGPLVVASRKRRYHSIFDHPPTSPIHWGDEPRLEDFWLAYQASGVDDDYFIM